MIQASHGFKDQFEWNYKKDEKPRVFSNFSFINKNVQICYTIVVVNIKCICFVMYFCQMWRYKKAVPEVQIQNQIQGSSTVQDEDLGEIHVKPLTGEASIIKGLTKTDCVFKLAEEVAKAQGIEPNLQRLIFDHKSMHIGESFQIPRKTFLKEYDLFYDNVYKSVSIKSRYNGKVHQRIIDFFEGGLFLKGVKIHTYASEDITLTTEETLRKYGKTRYPKAKKDSYFKVLIKKENVKNAKKYITDKKILDVGALNEFVHVIKDHDRNAQLLPLDFRYRIKEVAELENGDMAITCKPDKTKTYTTKEFIVFEDFISTWELEEIKNMLIDLDDYSDRLSFIFTYKENHNLGHYGLTKTDKPCEVNLVLQLGGQDGLICERNDFVSGNSNMHVIALETLTNQELNLKQSYLQGFVNDILLLADHSWEVMSSWTDLQGLLIYKKKFKLAKIFT